MAINILLFMVGINFMHYGQLILPVICFILFVDNRFVFRVNKPVTFIVLCLFAISFYAFSYQLGFYSVMGFTMPMAYYIGSNIKRPTENNIKKIIYLFAISMACHVILNMIFEYFYHGQRAFFMSTTHYDFWTRDKIGNTTTAVNDDIIIGCLYYLLFHEKNRSVKILSLSVFAISMFYLLVIGRRTPVLMIGLVVFLSFMYELFILKTMSEKVKKAFIRVVSCAALIVGAVLVIYHFDLFGSRAVLGEYNIFLKFSRNFLDDERFVLYFSSFPLLFKYPFGGQHISSELGDYIHDLLIDIYDYAGVVTFGITIVYIVLYLKTLIRLFKSDKISNDFKLLCFGVFFCIVLQMFVEPVMSGSSLFLIVAIMINANVERLIDEQ